jgi:predicted nucleic acid-binding protein
LKISKYIFDTGPLAKLVHPKANHEFIEWFNQFASQEIDIFIPEIADYELRRELLLNNFTESIKRLDNIEKTLNFLPLTTHQMREAARLWSEALKKGKPTADDKALDGDMILTAQASDVGAIIITENVGHLSEFADAVNWRNISMSS